MAEGVRRDGGPRSAIVIGVDRGILRRIVTGCVMHEIAGLGLCAASTVHPP